MAAAASNLTTVGASLLLTGYAGDERIMMYASGAYSGCAIKFELSQGGANGTAIWADAQAITLDNSLLEASRALQASETRIWKVPRVELAASFRATLTAWASGTVACSATSYSSP
jgi:hypothetical protein